MVELMRSVWNGTAERTDLPVLDSMQINRLPSMQAVYLHTGNSFTARAFYSPPMDTTLFFVWEIRPEAKYAAYAGQGEIEPMPLPGLENQKEPELRFIAPAEQGAYRLFVYVSNDQGNFSTANLPFYVR